MHLQECYALLIITYWQTRLHLVQDSAIFIPSTILSRGSYVCFLFANFFHRAVASKKTNWLVNWWSYIPPRRSLCTKVSAMDDGCASENGSHPDAKISKSFSYIAQSEWWCWLVAFRTTFMTLGSCNDSNIKICHTYSCRMWMDWLRAPAGAKKYFIMCLHSSESLQISWRVFFKAFLQRTLAVWLDQCHHQCVCLLHVGSLTSSSSRCTTPLSWCFVSPSRYCLVLYGVVWCWIVLYGIVVIVLSCHPDPSLLFLRFHLSTPMPKLHFRTRFVKNLCISFLSCKKT